jgi:hypothetical protein
VSCAQLIRLGMTRRGIESRLSSGVLVAVEEGVFAFAPLLEHDERGRWMGATLTCPCSFLSHVSAATAWGFWGLPRDFEIVTRPGTGGPRRHGDILAFRSTTLAGETTELDGIPITTPERTLLELARHVSARALARALREAIRLNRTSLTALGDHLGRARGRRGAARLGAAIARYAGLPLERARSGAEVRAIEILRDAGRPLPSHNARVAGEEADLSWASHRLIVEIDGAPFHRDTGEDRRKSDAWRAAGWAVRRLPSDDVYENPARLLRLAPTQPDRAR